MTLADKVAEAHAIVDAALATHLGDHRLAGQVVLFSGGNDSTTLAHLFRDRATHAAHANTTIGVERTRQFVRDCCATWGLPLLERAAPTSYHDLVLESGAFPGPAMHFRMYQRLKERGLREVRRTLVTNPRRERVLFIAGRRRSESERRAEVPEHERLGSTIWASPFANWTKDDLTEYREAYDVPRNPVADDLGMSGECLCGAFAEPGEFDRIAAVDPDAAEAILALERALHDRHAASRRHALSTAHALRIDAQACEDEGLYVQASVLRDRAATLEATPAEPGPRCRWGWGAYRADPDSQPSKVGPLCSSCDARFTPTRDTTPSPELAAVLARRRERTTA